MTIAYIQIGILFLVLAAAMPLARGEKTGKWFGIRTPQTISNIDIWNRVHTLAWIPMVLAAFIVFAGLFVVTLFGLQNNLLLCILLVLGGIIVSGIVTKLIISRVSSDYNVQISPTSVTDFENVMALQTKGMKIAGYATGVILILLAILLPFIASYGPDSIIGIRTRITENSVRIWEIVHTRAILPTLLGGIALGLMSYFVMKTRWRPSTKLWSWMVLYFSILGVTAKFAIWW